MPEDKESEIAGISHANMDLENAKETSLKHAHLNSMISTPKPFPSSSASKQTPTISLPKDPSVPLNSA